MQSCNISIAAGTQYTIVVNDVSGTSAGSNYTLQLPLCAFGTVDGLFKDGFE